VPLPLGLHVLHPAVLPTAFLVAHPAVADLIRRIKDTVHLWCHISSGARDNNWLQLRQRHYLRLLLKSLSVVEVPDAAEEMGRHRRGIHGVGPCISGGLARIRFDMPDVYNTLCMLSHSIKVTSIAMTCDFTND
jgi:hypothetical protein